MHKLGKQYVILLIIMMAVVFFCGVKYGEYLSRTQVAALAIGGTADAYSPVSSAPSAEKIIYVDLKGAVERPGVYGMKQGERLNDLLSEGGLLPDADISFLNLAQILFDAQVVTIPSKSAADFGDQSQPSAPQNSSGKININTASDTELEKLSGIGLAKAGAIINYRRDHGFFTTIEDIKKVSGIGESIFEQIKDAICVE